MPPSLADAQIVLRARAELALRRRRGGGSRAPLARTRLPAPRQVPGWALPLDAKARYKAAYGGRGSGKSHEFAERLVELCVQRPSLRAVGIREVQDSIDMSVKALIEAKIIALGVSDQFDVRANKILRVGGTGLIAFKGMQDHTAASIKSLEGFSLAWVEEAQSISQKSLDLLLPTIRMDGSEVWFSWNPDSKSDPVDAMFRGETPVPDAVVVSPTYLDNPHCPETLRNEALRMEALDADKYQHIWRGGYNLGGKGRVYANFVNKPYPEGNVDAAVEDYGGTLYVGQDFNVNPMASVIVQRVGDECHVLDAIKIETSNTVQVCEEIKTRFPNRHVVFCPDPAGNQRRSSTTVVGQTDFTIIRSFGFEVRAPSAHPAVVDRVNNVNLMLCEKGRRRVRICPRAAHLIEAQASQVFKKDTSIPDKKGGFDHMNDAFGYVLWQEFNVATESASSSTFEIG